LYDPTIGTFTATGSANRTRTYHTATLLNSGKVLGAGGAYSATTAEVYDPATGTFTYAPANLSTVRYLHTATLLPNGMVLLAGGDIGSVALSSAELFNPATGTFTLTGSLNAGRYVHTATVLDNGMVLLAGGTSNGSTPLASAELY